MNTNDIKYIIPDGWVSGIYKITAPNGHYYYGSTINFKKRWYLHFCNIQNTHIKNVYKKYPTGWVCEAIERVEPIKEILAQAEQRYITEHFGKPGCMNINPIASIPPNNKGRKMSLESITKRVSKVIGVKRPAEVCVKISATKKGKPAWNKGIKTGIIRIGYKHSMETIVKMKAGHIGRKRRPQTDETRMKIRNSNLKRGKIFKWCHKTTGIEFLGSPRNLSLKYPDQKLFVSNLYCVAKGIIDNHKGWTCPGVKYIGWRK